MAATVRRSRRSRYRPANELGFGRSGTARVGRRAGTCSDKDVREGPSRGENGGEKSAIVGEEGIPQKEVEEVGDWHLPRKKDDREGC